MHINRPTNFQQLMELSISDLNRLDTLTDVTLVPGTGEKVKSIDQVFPLLICSLLCPLFARSRCMGSSCPPPAPSSGRCYPAPSLPAWSTPSCCQVRSNVVLTKEVLEVLECWNTKYRS